MYFIINLFRDLWSSRRLIFSLAKNDFTTRYAGSYFGILWAFVQPVMTILVFWFVFEVGFRTARVSETPFILWLSCGLVPWFFFIEAWGSATNSFIEYSYLVKKVVFRISSLPLIKVISSLFIHFFFLVFLIVMFLAYGYTPGLLVFQLLYYTFCMVVLSIALSLLTASIVPFFRDLTQIVSIILQFGMWLTPIMWPYTMLSPEYHWLLSFNPMFYVVEGFRDTLINKVCFWEHLNSMLFFWVVTFTLLFVGAWMFKKLKPHFADVL